jgi:transcriptional regulator with XRE-family HTH domain
MVKSARLFQVSARFNSIKKIPSWIKTLGAWANQLKAIREALGMTQAQLAKRLATTQISISRLENEDVSPTLKTMTKIANSLNCDLVVAMVPRKELSQTVEELANKKAVDLNTNMATNDPFQKKQLSRLNRDILKADFIENKRNLLWEETPGTKKDQEI